MACFFQNLNHNYLTRQRKKTLKGKIYGRDQDDRAASHTVLSAAFVNGNLWGGLCMIKDAKIPANLDCQM